jgi:hypothetical protein
MFVRVFSLAGALACATGCVVNNTPPDGTLTMQWTVDEATDPNLCSQGSAATFELTVYDPGGNAVGSFHTDCAAFVTTVQLAPGSYSADARLLDASNADRTTTIPVNPFTIRSDSDLNIAVAFRRRPSNERAVF